MTRIGWQDFWTLDWQKKNILWKSKNCFYQKLKKRKNELLDHGHRTIRSLNIFNPCDFLKYGITGPHVRPSQWSQNTIFAVKSTSFDASRSFSLHNRLFLYFISYFRWEIDHFSCKNDHFRSEIGHYSCKIGLRILKNLHFTIFFSFLSKKYCNKLIRKWFPLLGNRPVLIRIGYFYCEIGHLYF